MVAKTSRSLVNALGAVWILLVLTTVAFAQTTQGALIGTVSDVNGARVAEATG